MSRAVALQCVLVLLLSCCALVSTGCSGGSNAAATSRPADVRASRALSVFYQEFMSTHGGAPPQNEAEFREFLGTLADRLQAGGLDADKLLTSPDGGPWIVGYGRPLEVDGRRIIAYSRNSIDGKRMVINERGGVESIEESKLPAAAP